VCIVVGRSSHPQAVIEDLWKRAVEAMGQLGAELTGTAVYESDGGPVVSVPDQRLSVVALAKSSSGRVDSLMSAAAGQPGPVGIAGRLLRDNLESRRLARALAGRADLQEKFRRSSVVVAADLTADRSVWQLRNHTAAELVHGPAAMLHALRQSARKQSAVPSAG
jgi:hypothetical protein